LTYIFGKLIQLDTSPAARPPTRPAGRPARRQRYRPRQTTPRDNSYQRAKQYWSIRRASK